MDVAQRVLDTVSDHRGLFWWLWSLRVEVRSGQGALGMRHSECRASRVSRRHHRCLHNGCNCC